MALRDLIHRVTLDKTVIRIELSRRQLSELIFGSLDTANDSTDGLIRLEAPMELRRRGVESKIVLPASPPQSSGPDGRLIGLIAHSHQWLAQLRNGEIGSMREIAERDDLDPGDVSRFLPLAFLAPDIVEAIATGDQPVELTVEELRRRCPISLSWEEQRKALGFSH